jgi:hypothetical protein
MLGSLGSSIFSLPEYFCSVEVADEFETCVYEGASVSLGLYDLLKDFLSESESAIVIYLVIKSRDV